MICCHFWRIWFIKKQVTSSTFKGGKLSSTSWIEERPKILWTYFVFWQCHKACRILVPDQGDQTYAPCSGNAGSLITGPLTKSLDILKTISRVLAPEYYSENHFHIAKGFFGKFLSFWEDEIKAFLKALFSFCLSRVHCSPLLSLCPNYLRN